MSLFFVNVRHSLRQRGLSAEHIDPVKGPRSMPVRAAMSATGHLERAEGAERRHREHPLPRVDELGLIENETGGGEPSGPCQAAIFQNRSGIRMPRYAGRRRPGPAR